MTSILRLFATLVICVPALHAAAQVPSNGILLVAHGGGPDWNKQVLDLAAAVRFAGPVRVSFLMGPGAGERPFQREVAALRAAGVTRVAIVPLFISSHSEHFDQLRYLVGLRDSLDATMMHHLHMGGIERPADRTGLTLLAALDSAPELADALAARAVSLVPDRAQRAVLVLGHGPNGAEDYARWMAALRPVAERVRQRAGYRLAAVELVRDDAPPMVRAEAVARVREIVTWLSQLTGAPVAVVPALVATGAVSQVTLKKDLEGLPVEYLGNAMLPNLGMARWVERVAAGALAAP
ncbi:MAG: CbiX/SirB N-terminal domain-containing protein [Gemmatimonadaceae bacterium]|jgi:sirohydrochlorin ferrochelatase